MTHATAHRPAAPAERLMPPVPGSLAETGLSGEFVTDLLLKTLYVQGARSGAELAEFLKLPFPLLDDLLIDLQQRRYVEVRGTREDQALLCFVDVRCRDEFARRDGHFLNDFATKRVDEPGLTAGDFERA